MNKAHSGAIVLDLEGVDEGRNVINFAVTAAGIEFADPYFQFPSPIEVDLLINRSLHTLSVKASVRFALVGECCRCTGRAEENVKADSDFLIQHMVATPEELEAMEEDEDVVMPSSSSSVRSPTHHKLASTSFAALSSTLPPPRSTKLRHCHSGGSGSASSSSAIFFSSANPAASSASNARMRSSTFFLLALSSSRRAAPNSPSSPTAARSDPSAVLTRTLKLFR